MDCIFCKIIKGEIPSYKIYEDDKIYAFLDINPCHNGHTLVIPKEHTTDLTTISQDVLNHIMAKSKDIAKLLDDKLNMDGYTITQNNGFVEEVKHFHIHIIPKYINEKKMTVEEVHKKITL